MSRAPRSLYIGIDCGTSGVRAVAIDDDRHVVGQSSVRMADISDDIRAPSTWQQAMHQAMATLLASINISDVRAISIDGTSGTVLPVDEQGSPLASALMYNDAVQDTDIIDRIAAVAPVTSAVHGASSALGRCLSLQATPGVVRFLHQADWLAGEWSGRYNITDENNALKTGYDPVEREWPAWMTTVGLGRDQLPDVVPPGTIAGRVTNAVVDRCGLNANTVVVTGTTDGCASFLATGADEVGDAVTALGTTLTVKLLSDVPLYAPEYGLYSHRLGDRWLAGGASNTGGNVLLKYFDADAIETLSARIDAHTSSGLDYYPLPKPGERFPVNDPNLQPRVTPRPDDDATFLHGLLEGIASVEALAYEQLQALGAPSLKCLRTVGGGSVNDTWSTIRQQRLNVPFEFALSTDAAVGTAVLARQGTLSVAS